MLFYWLSQISLNFGIAGYLFFASLISYRAAGFASGLAAGLAFAATSVLGSINCVDGYNFYMLHNFLLKYKMIIYQNAIFFNLIRRRVKIGV